VSALDHFRSLLSVQHAKLCLGLPLLSALLLVLCQPPISLFFLAYVALIPLLLCVGGTNPYSACMAGLVTGIASYLGLVYWVVIAMNSYGGLDLITSSLVLLLLVTYLSLYTGCFALSVSYLEGRLSIPVYVTAPVIWVLLEYLRGIALTGFPWSFLAHSQHNFPAFIQVASITGSYFISYLLVSVNCMLFCLLTRRPLSPLFTIAICALCTASIVYGMTRLQGRDEGALTAAIIQGNIRQDIKWDRAFQVKTIRTYYRDTMSGGKDSDLVLWPETAMPLVLDDEPNVQKYIATLPASLHTRLLLGAISRDGGGRYYNAVHILGLAGEKLGTYRKVHLVPFGEFTPLARYFPFLEKITATGAGFFSGGSHDPIRTDLGKVGVLICYEGTFPSIAVETVRRGAQVLVNTTNDAWYNRTSAPFQHLVFYIFRAIETDRYVLRAANTGISAIIDPKGRVTGDTPLFREAVLRGRFGLISGLTPYVRYGDYFVVLLCLGLGAALAVPVYRRLKSK
jgi:apolipoprotein N-acyltransferase